LDDDDEAVLTCAGSAKTYTFQNYSQFRIIEEYIPGRRKRRRPKRRCVQESYTIYK
jgi:hypothetical protein